MFLAHLPAGYLISRWWQRDKAKPVALSWGLLGSILPDFDHAWLWWVDHKQAIHHLYWTHLPLFWLIVWAVVQSVCRIAGWQRAGAISALLLLNVFGHLVLDSLVGGIWWLYPWVAHPFALSYPLLAYEPAWSRPIVRSCMVLEVVVIVVAVYCWRKDRQTVTPSLVAAAVQY